MVVQNIQIRYTGNGKIDRFKARFVMKGFLQEHGIDYNKIFSPVIRINVLRLPLAIAVLLDLEIHQMDVKTAFINSFFQKEIYMAQPKGFLIAHEENLAGKLLKSLYGLKLARRVRYKTLSAILESLDFHKLIKDSCGFKRAVNDVTYYTAVYVDDLWITAPTPALSIQRDCKNKTIFIHQHKYAAKFLDRFSDYIPYLIATPSERNANLSVSKSSSEAEKDAMKDIPYRQAIGSIMYLMVSTRPDIACYMREVSQFIANPGMEHWKAGVRYFKYLSGTNDYDLLLGGSLDMTPKNLTDNLTAFSDSDYANCPETRRSVSGYVTTRKPNLVALAYHIVILSTTETEYIALCHWMQEMIFLKLLLHELGSATTQTSVTHDDNQSCIKIWYNPEVHGRSKHIRVRYCFVQEKIERHEFTFTYCNTIAMVADIFTKALDKHRFRELKAKFRLQNPGSSIRPIYLGI
ncbi:LOW QUALITY PROTEIN: Retrovirus-related pol Polyprotein [Phytophthora palmivora]|uniref:Retrovirus-related pol Polyprotein n=1 Tax=Phytophthora palmivora TaxID=4796 RepID=A0A2P4XMH7_9STRA|nr:LOW QUALITY PROTEIN: Retrovirus-related pol Polyprotein [Phytophthora palmivora]